MVNFAQTALSSFVVAFDLISMRLVIAYRATGCSIELGNPQFSVIVLLVGLIVQYLFSGLLGLSAFMPYALTLAFFCMACIDSKRGNSGLILRRPLPEEGVRFVGSKGAMLTLVNACLLTALALALSIAWLSLCSCCRFPSADLARAGAAAVYLWLSEFLRRRVWGRCREWSSVLYGVNEMFPGTQTDIDSMRFL